MKNRIFLTAGIVFLLSLLSYAQNEVNVKQALTKNLIQTAVDRSIVIGGKIIIKKSDYCETFNCEAYFKDYQDQIQFYTLEDLFMRAQRSYIDIKKIDEENAVISLSIYMENKFEDIEIKP